MSGVGEGLNAGCWYFIKKNNTLFLKMFVWFYEIYKNINQKRAVGVYDYSNYTDIDSIE